MMAVVDLCRYVRYRCRHQYARQRGYHRRGRPAGARRVARQENAVYNNHMAGNDGKTTEGS